MIEYTEHGVFVPADDAPIEDLPMKRGTYGSLAPARPNIGDYERGVTSLEQAERLLVEATAIVRWHRAEAERKRRERAQEDAAATARLVQVMGQNIAAGDLALMEQLDPLFLDRLAHALRGDKRASIRIDKEDQT